MRFLIAVGVACAATAAVGAQNAARVIAPPAYRAGQMPALPVMALGGGDVFVELTVSDRGAVKAVRPLRITDGYTELVLDAVSTWQFTPAEELIDPRDRTPGGPATRAVESTVLVAALFRPPAVYGGNTLGEPSVDVANPSPDVPFPVATAMPALPLNFRDPGVVMMEARVDDAGAVTDARIRRPFPPFDQAALDSAGQWRFRPGRLAASSRVYLLFGFRLPDAPIVH